MTWRHPDKAAEACCAAHHPLGASGNAGQPLEGGRGGHRGRVIDLERVVRESGPKLVALRPRVSERTAIDEQVRGTEAQGHRERIRVAVTVAQRAVRSRIDDRDRGVRIPSVTQYGES